MEGYWTYILCRQVWRRWKLLISFVHRCYLQNLLQISQMAYEEKVSFFGGAFSGFIVKTAEAVTRNRVREGEWHAAKGPGPGVKLRSAAEPRHMAPPGIRKFIIFSWSLSGSWGSSHLGFTSFGQTNVEICNSSCFEQNVQQVVILYLGIVWKMKIF